MNIEIPDAPIKTSGFPTCAHPQNDKREVENAGDVCRLDGGKPASMEMIRRSAHRQMRLGLRQILACRQCREIPPNEARCPQCAWFRGVMMGIAGLMEQVYGQEEFE